MIKSESITSNETSATIQLRGVRANGRSALVDSSLLPALLQWSWHVNSDGYVRRTLGQKMHRDVMTLCGEDPSGKIIDHINGNKLDNRRSNLRFASPRQNQLNKRTRSRRTGLKGVYQCGGKFRVIVRVNGKSVHLGVFADRDEAAATYDRWCQLNNGEFAITNRDMGLG